MSGRKIKSQRKDFFAAELSLPAREMLFGGWVDLMPINAGVHEKGILNISDLLKSTRDDMDFKKVGGIAMFIGVVRGETENGEEVKELELEAYKEQADTVLRSICNELQTRDGIVDVQVHHFTGRFQNGEEIVYVLVAGSHRNEIFPVLREAIKRYKKEAPIFKKETVVDKKGAVKSHWIESA